MCETSKAPRRAETKQRTIRRLEGHPLTLPLSHGERGWREGRLILEQTIFAELEQQGKMPKKVNCSPRPGGL
jgi:hypothetical protein